MAAWFSSCASVSTYVVARRENPGNAASISPFMENFPHTEPNTLAILQATCTTLRARRNTPPSYQAPGPYTRNSTRFVDADYPSTHPCRFLATLPPSCLSKAIPVGIYLSTNFLA